MPDQIPEDDRTAVISWRPQAHPDAGDGPTEVLPKLTGPGAQAPGADASIADSVSAGSSEDPPPARRSRVGLWVGLGLAAAIVLGCVAFYVIDVLRTEGTIERGTSIAGVDVGGLTPEQATAALTAELGPAYEESVTVSAHGEDITLSPGEAGLTPDIAGAVEAAGLRSASPVDRVTSFWRSSEVPLHVQVDQSALTAWVEQVAADTDVEAVEGELSREGSTVVAIEPVIGRHLEVAESVAALEQAWRTGGPQALAGLELPTTTEPVRVSAESLAAAKEQAETLVSGDLSVKNAKETLTVPQRVVAEAVSIEPDEQDGFAVTIDTATIRKEIQAKTEATNTKPKDAVVALADGKPTITPSVTGRTVNWKATDKALAAALAAPERTWTVAYTKTEPEFSTADAKALGLNEVIGEFTTSGFSWASGQNVKVVAEKVQGAIVMPGETFGLNAFTGPRGIEQGYIESGIIQEGVLSTAVGGGISQFATTLYNAAYFAGMGDVTHTPHSFYISRYPMGREATVFDGEIELAFSNDYDTAVMIQTIWTESDITVRLWGTKHVEIESVTGEPFNYTAPVTKTIPYGQSCSPSGGSSGYSVVNTRIFKDLSGKVIKEEPFTTVYNGQVQVICEPPPAPATTAPATTAGGATPPAATPPAATPPAAGG